MLNVLSTASLRAVLSNVADMATYMKCSKQAVRSVQYRLGLVNSKVKTNEKVDDKDKIVEEVENKMEQKIVNIVSSFTLNCENIKGIDLRDRLEGLVRMINDTSDYEIKVEFKEYEKWERKNGRK